MMPSHRDMKELTNKSSIAATPSQPGYGYSPPEPDDYSGRTHLGPLSIQQRCLVSWMQGNSANWQGLFYNFSVKINGLLNEEFFSQSVYDIVKRHDSLRTTFIATESNEFRASIQDAGSFSLQIVDLSAYDKKSAFSAVKNDVELFFSRNTHLLNTTPFLPKLYMFSETEYIFTVLFHHICSDHHSWTLFFRELWSAYYGMVHGKTTDICREPDRYLDYAIDQDRQKDGWLREHGAYWQSKLAAVAQIPQSNGNGITETLDIEVVQRLFPFSEKARTELLHLAKKLHMIPALVMLGVYAWVVSQKSGSIDYILPVSVNGRRHAKQFKMIGVFSQYLYLRIRKPADAEFYQFLKNVQNEYFTSLRHQDCGWVSESHPGHFSGAIFNYISGSLDGLIALPPDYVRDSLSDLRISLMPGYVQSGIIYSRDSATEAILAGKISALFYEDGQNMFCKLFCTDELVDHVHSFFDAICQVIQNMSQDCTVVADAHTTPIK